MMGRMGYDPLCPWGEEVAGGKAQVVIIDCTGTHFCICYKSGMGVVAYIFLWLHNGWQLEVFLALHIPTLYPPQVPGQCIALCVIPPLESVACLGY